MTFDFKKEYKEFYMPKDKPEIIDVPIVNYIAVRGKGDPNQEEGAYSQAISVLYAVAYTIKMSYKGDYQIKGFFEYVVPPLEGFWWQDHVKGVDYSDKSTFNWISVIRLPDFVAKEDFDWAVTEASKKKKIDCSSAEYLTINEGICVQIMHIGSFDDEPATVAIMDDYLKENGYENNITETRLHHEIYLSDARKVEPAKWKTVIRHPIKKSEISTQNSNKCELLQNLDKLHTTDMGIDRIRKNLSIDVCDVVQWCYQKIKSSNAIIKQKGKNWYVNVDNCVITVNAHSYTIITAHKGN